MWWFVGILAVAVVALAVVLARRGSTGGSTGFDTPGGEAGSLRRGTDSGLGAGGS